MNQEKMLIFYTSMKQKNWKIFLIGIFFEWSNFDGLGRLSSEQWFFSKALEVYKGKKIDIKCYCCEKVYFIPNNFENIKKEKCYGKKSAYMIEKIVDEINLAKKRREGDGTYSA